MLMSDDSKNKPSVDDGQTRPLRVLYCRCAYAQVVPDEVKDEVLEGLCTSGQAFDTVSDLCEMSARRDPALRRIAEAGDVKIAACYKRAVRGLFQAAGSPLPEQTPVLNMRADDAKTILRDLAEDSEDQT